MGLFWESKKEKEAREERALEAMLKAFMENPDSLQPKQQTPPKTTSMESVQKRSSQPQPERSSRIQPTVDTLAQFLIQKGLINKDEWDLFCGHQSSDLPKI